MKEITLKQFLKEKFKGSWNIQNALRGNKQRENILKKNYKNLTLQEKESYENLMGRIWDGGVTLSFILRILFFPIYALFYLGIFSIVLRFGFDLDLSTSFLYVVGVFGKIWYPNGLVIALVLLIIIAFQSMHKRDKLREELLWKKLKKKKRN